MNMYFFSFLHRNSRSHIVPEINVLLQKIRRWSRERDFCEMSPAHSADTLFFKIAKSTLLRYPVDRKFHQNRSISHCFQDKYIFFVLRRNSRWPPKMAGKRFWGKSPVDSAYTLWVENFVEITLSCIVSEISVFAFYTEIQDGCQKWRKSDFCKKSPVDSADNLRIKNFVEIVLSRTVSKIDALLCFTQKFKMAAKSGGKAIFGKSCQYTLLIP